ncbi:hypothetical protein [[Mycoplasma] testudinis]|uniref:hypothetical protein n=1 Tax=[Mycoplasma] testudinis TaxID=33924 RepID=UPI0004847A31|nr:hypothetical protein [[Mycoplasma] testudinis]
MAKNKSRFKKRFWRISTFFGMLVIPAVIVAACSSPASQKYITTVSEFQGLNQDANSAPSDTNKKVIIKFSQVVPAGGTPNSNIKQVDAADPTKEVGFTGTNLAAFSATFGSAANSIGYQLAKTATTFASTVSNFNRQVPENQHIQLFTQPEGSNIRDQFYQALADSFLIGNSAQNIGFGVSDISFNFRKLTPTIPANQTKPYDSTANGIYDVRADNKAIVNSTIDIRANPSTGTAIPFNAANAQEIADNDVNNRLVKLYAITDINVVFRFFVAGVDQGSTVPPRNSIISSQNEKQEVNGLQNPVDVLKNLWSGQNFGNLTTLAFDVKMQDLIAPLLYTATVQEKTATDGTKSLEHTVTPSTLLALAPMSLYYPSLSPDFPEKPNTKIVPANAATVVPSSIMDVLLDPSKILTTDQLGLAVAAQPAVAANGNTPARPAVEAKPAQGFSLQQSTILNVTNSFLNRLRDLRSNPLGLKSEVVGHLPTTKTDADGKVEADTPVALTLEDYFRLYFNPTITAVDVPNPAPDQQVVLPFTF